MVKPLAVMMLGSQVPSPIATPKKAEKQIMPAITRRRKHFEHDRERIGLAVARGAGRKLLFWTRDAQAREHVERFLAAAMRRQIARRLRQRKAEYPDDQRADANNDPDAAPAD